MNDDYLWDGSGNPDPEVERLERILSRLRSKRPPPELPKDLPLSPEVSEATIELSEGKRRRVIPYLAVAAAVLVAILGSWFYIRQPEVSWPVETLAGAPQIGSSAIQDRGSISVGQWIETDANSRARIGVGLVGHVEIEPNSRLRLLNAGATEHRLSLQVGKISAKIKAPPRLFIVETPSATAVDLGCEYTLGVDREGSCVLRVTGGWVAFEWKERESTVPAGAACYTRPGQGPGTPFYEDSSEALQAALIKLDFERGGPEDLAIILTESRQKDSMTLWHLLARVEGNMRVRVYDRLAELLQPPEKVTREGILNLDFFMLQLWKDKIDITMFRK